VEPKVLMPPAESALVIFDWPGNVRQFVNACRRLTVTAPGREIRAEDIPQDLGGAAAGHAANHDWIAKLSHWAERELDSGTRRLLDQAVPEVERILIRVALRKADGLKQDAAKLLGWGRNTLSRKMKELGMEDVSAKRSALAAEPAQSHRRGYNRAMLNFAKNLTADQLLLGNSVTEWLIAGLVGIAVWSGLWILRKLIASRYKGYSSARNPTAIRLIAYLIGNTKQVLFLAIALDAAQETLTFPPRIQHIVSNIVLLLILVQVGLWAGRTLRFYLATKEAERGADQVFAGSLDIINFVAGMLIWSLLVLVALDNFGVNITALLAGLGVGGVAVALALQNVLGDLFASLSIALDKPFVVGDSLTIDTFVGKVEHIGIKTTRLRSESGEQIILSNADILKSRVRNYGRAPELRALATIRVAYSTPLETLHAIPKLMEGIVREQPNARFDRCHLKGLESAWLEFELSFFVQQPRINSLLDLQQEVNFRIIDEFRRLGVAFAYPTQRVVVDAAGFPGAAARMPPSRTPSPQSRAGIPAPEGGRPRACCTWCYSSRRSRRIPATSSVCVPIPARACI
jgi:small-conductance mechanosensitive channel